MGKSNLGFILFTVILSISSLGFSAPAKVSSNLTTEELEQKVAEYAANQITQMIKKEGMYKLDKPCSEDSDIPDNDNETTPACPVGTNKWVKGVKKRNYTVSTRNITIQSSKDNAKTIGEGLYGFGIIATGATLPNGVRKDINVIEWVEIQLTQTNGDQFSIDIKKLEVYNANYGNN
jgi:hypothetical protein